MANDRLLLICKKCNAYRTLAKYFPSTGLRQHAVEAFHEFMNEHLRSCHPGKWGAASFTGDSPFRLDVESSTDGPWNADREARSEADDSHHEDPCLKEAVTRILAREDNRAPANQCPVCGCSTIGESITGVYRCESCKATWEMGRYEEGGD